jgi:hypothetical protein
MPCTILGFSKRSNTKWHPILGQRTRVSFKLRYFKKLSAISSSSSWVTEGSEVLLRRRYILFELSCRFSTSSRCNDSFKSVKIKLKIEN